MPRSTPNILITGTPGVGKTTLCETLVTLSSNTTSPLKHVSINDIAKRHNLYTSYDERLQTQVLDEDGLLDQVESMVADGNDKGGWIFDYHVPDIFPERWVDLVVVLRCSDTREFYARMDKRRYGEAKAQENIDAEIFGVILEEAEAGYEKLKEAEWVWALESVDSGQVDANAEMIMEWVGRWGERKAEEE